MSSRIHEDPLHPGEFMVTVWDEDDDEEDDDEGVYHRPESEYLRPPRSVLLHPKSGTPIKVDVAGVFACNHVLDKLVVDQPLEMELVPEPGNPWDNQAVSVEVDQGRIGYLPSYLAADWHDCLRFLNRRGFAGYVPGSIRHSRTGHAWASVRMPGEAALYRFAGNVGVFAQCDAVLSKLAAPLFEDAVENREDMSEDLALAIEGLKEFAPDLSWSDDLSLTAYERIPQAIVLRLDDVSAERKRTLANDRRRDRQRAQDEKSDELARARSEKAEARQGLLNAVVVQTKDGKSQREISALLGCSVNTVAALQKKAGVRPAQWTG